MSMYTGDGDIILRDGKPMTISELLTVLNIYEADLQFIRRQISVRVGTFHPSSGKPGWVGKIWVENGRVVTYVVEGNAELGKE